MTPNWIDEDADVLDEIVIRKNPPQLPPKGMREVSAQHLGNGVWMIRYEKCDGQSERG